MWDISEMLFGMSWGTTQGSWKIIWEPDENLMRTMMGAHQLHLKTSKSRVT
jgi:hypothetical protein